MLLAITLFVPMDAGAAGVELGWVWEGCAPATEDGELAGVGGVLFLPTAGRQAQRGLGDTLGAYG